ncbi:hypothetical protein K1719_020357 [Acacia pycnantha]|nr:hypothetical protein K1719_020357 [Acacia pycnantha]
MFLLSPLILQPIVEAFLLLAMVTSYIRFVLGLTYFLVDSAMSWSDRYSTLKSSSSPPLKLPELVSEGKITLLLVLGSSGYVVLS